MTFSGLLSVWQQRCGEQPWWCPLVLPHYSPRQWVTILLRGTQQFCGVQTPPCPIQGHNGWHQCVRKATVEREPEAQVTFICSLLSCWRNICNRCHKANIDSTCISLDVPPACPQPAALFAGTAGHCWNELAEIQAISRDRPSSQSHLRATKPWDSIAGTSMGPPGRRMTAP